jgi:hypothetical protein
LSLGKWSCDTCKTEQGPAVKPSLTAPNLATMPYSPEEIMAALAVPGLSEGIRYPYGLGLPMSLPIRFRDVPKDDMAKTIPDSEDNDEDEDMEMMHGDESDM